MGSSKKFHHLAMVGAAGLLLLAGCSDDGGGGEDAQADETTTPTTDFPIGVDSCTDIPESEDVGALNQGAIVNMIEFEFCQDDITVEVGETVRWENNGSTRHQVMHAPGQGKEALFGPDEAMLA